MMEFIQLGIGRWLHIAAGVMWIGLLYYFNFVQGHVLKQHSTLIFPVHPFAQKRILFESIDIFMKTFAHGVKGICKFHDLLRSFYLDRFTVLTGGDGNDAITDSSEQPPAAPGLLCFGSSAGADHDVDILSGDKGNDFLASVDGDGLDILAGGAGTDTCHADKEDVVRLSCENVFVY